MASAPPRRETSSAAESLLQERQREIPAHVAEVLLGPSGRRVLVAVDVRAVNGCSWQKLVCELVYGGAADSPADRLDQFGSSDVCRRVGDGAAREKRKAHSALTAETGDPERLASHLDVPPESFVNQPLHDTNPVGRITSL